MFGYRQYCLGLALYGPRTTGAHHIHAVVLVDDVLGNIVVPALSDALVARIHSSLAALFNPNLVGSHAILVWNQ